MTGERFLRTAATRRAMPASMTRTPWKRRLRLACLALVLASPSQEITADSQLRTADGTAVRHTDTAISLPTKDHESPHETVSDKEALLLGRP